MYNLKFFCRTYCNLLRPELSRLLEQKLETGQSFFTLFRAVHHLEQVTLRWAPGVLGKSICPCLSTLLCNDSIM